MLLKYCLATFFSLIISSAWAQAPSHDYFPPSLCQKLGIKSISVYRTKVDSSAKTTNPNKTIRLAKDATRYWEFDSIGRQVKVNVLLQGGEKSVQEVTRVYRDNQLVREDLEHFNTNNAGVTRLILKEVDFFSYDSASQRRHRVTNIVSGSEQIYLDSTTYTRDPQGRIVREILRNNPKYSKEVYEKRYTYSTDMIEVESFMNQFIINRDEYFLDQQGRIVKEINYFPDSKPTLQTNYSYDANGRLTQLDYVPNWDHFQPAETVIRRTNSYDSKGKLIEAKLQYADGNYELELYDYTFMSEE